MIRLVDTHNHLFVDEFTKSRQALASAVELAVDAGVFQMLICAGDWRSVLRTQTVAALINAGYAAGIHPLSFNPKTYCTEHNLIRDFIDQHLATSTLSAIGEIGLDGTITDKIPMEFQEKVFSDQLKLARDFQLPVSVHVRGAADLVAKHIRRIGIAGGAVHAFNGSLEQAKIFINLGLKLGYGGACTYSGSCRIRKLLSELPKDVLVLETDCPDMPSSIRRAENPEDAHSMPRDLRMYAEVAAELRDVSVEEIAEQTTKNAFGAFPKLQTLGAVKKVP